MTISPCPLCGSADVSVARAPYHLSCACGLSLVVIDAQTEAEAIAAWSRRAPSPAAKAIIGISDDYMTSEKHHPRHVLIPTAKFEELVAAEALMSGDASTDDPDAPACMADPWRNPPTQPHTPGGEE